jgi:hypothetical protein
MKKINREKNPGENGNYKKIELILKNNINKK